MPTETFFHVGIVVPDLDAALERYASLLGIPFTPVQDVYVPRLDDGVRSEPIRLRIAYSTGSPPYYELLEATGEGIYGAANAGGVHHVGIWEADCERRVQELRRLGLQLEATQYTPEGRIIVAYFDPGPLDGTRIEIVDEGRRAMMEQ